MQKPEKTIPHGELCIIWDKAFFVYNFGQFCFPNYFLIFRSIHARMVSFDQASLAENSTSRKKMLANYEHVDSLSQESISKTWIFEMAFFWPNFFMFSSLETYLFKVCAFFHPSSQLLETILAWMGWKMTELFAKQNCPKLEKKRFFQNCTQLLVLYCKEPKSSWESWRNERNGF